MAPAAGSFDAVPIREWQADTQRRRTRRAHDLLFRRHHISPSLITPIAFPARPAFLPSFASSSLPSPAFEASLSIASGQTHTHIVGVSHGSSATRT